jgi:glycosyltransferase involved in cell wall biosynthesis
VRVFLTGGDGIAWALDAERETTRRALGFVEFTNPFRCQVIHAVNWRNVLRFPRGLLVGRRIVCHMTHDPAVAFEDPEFALVSRLVTLWIVRSSGAAERMRSAGFHVCQVPYILDDSIFHPLDYQAKERAALRARMGIPEGVYAIGSFQRDTEGKDLASPKLVKGPDIFVEIVSRAARKCNRVHVVLAGPRRHWIRRRLEEQGISYTFLGKDVAGDDLRVNSLPRGRINALYGLIDLYLVSSRKEGGPQAILEAAGTRCRILSTDVGHARDVLHPSCIYGGVDDGASRILRDIFTGELDRTLQHNYDAAMSHLPGRVRELWREAYQELIALPPVGKEQVRDRPTWIAAVLGRMGSLCKRG